MSKRRSLSLTGNRNDRMVLILLAIVLVILILPFSADAQFSKSRADKEFENFNYSYALVHYHKIAKKRGPNYEIAKKIAESYRLMGNSKEAEVWYYKALAFPDVEPILFFHYGEALRN